MRNVTIRQAWAEIQYFDTTAEILPTLFEIFANIRDFANGGDSLVPISTRL